MSPFLVLYTMNTFLTQFHWVINLRAVSLGRFGSESHGCNQIVNWGRCHLKAWLVLVYLLPEWLSQTHTPNRLGLVVGRRPQFHPGRCLHGHLSVLVTWQQAASWGWFLSSRKHLAMTGDVGCWTLAGVLQASRGQGYCKTSYSAYGHHSQQIIVHPKLLTLTRLINLVLEPSNPRKEGISYSLLWRNILSQSFLQYFLGRSALFIVG